ncbi:MAG: hypothetical protein U0736_14910 [Gemmataceae bacterium]
MTDQEWWTSPDPQAVCANVREAATPLRTRWSGYRPARRFTVSDRKWRLIDLGCARRAIPALAIPQLGDIIAALEEHVDADLDTLGVVARVATLAEAVRPRLFHPAWLIHGLSNTLTLTQFLQAWRGGSDLFALTAEACVAAAVAALPPHERAAGRERLLADERARQADLVRDVLGYLFVADRPDPVWLQMNDGIVRRLAETMYHTRTYTDFPVLGDALEDAGCTSAAILDHCRGGGDHTRGCWVLDLLLGKE